MGVNTAKIAGEAVNATVATGLGFGMGCLAGKLSRGNVLLTGGIYAIVSLVESILGTATKYLAIKYRWNLSTVKFATAMTGTLMATALGIACFAAGIFGPLGLGLAVGIGVLFAAYPLGLGLYAKFGGKDMSYNEALKQSSPFYKFAT